MFHYKTGSYIPKHKDPSKGKKLYRFNIELVSAKKGGQFVCNKTIWSWRKMFLFRADDSYHYVTPIEEGERWVLSFGKLV